MARTKKVEQEVESSPAKGIAGFKSSEDVENFYRFVHENDFRNEALVMLRAVHKVLGEQSKKGKKKRARRKLH